MGYNPLKQPVQLFGTSSSLSDFHLQETSHTKTGTDYKYKDKYAVTIPYHYWLSETRITRGQYGKVVSPERIISDYNRGWSGYHQQQLNEIASVSVDSALNFCEIMTKSERSIGRVPSGYRYTVARIPHLIGGKMDGIHTLSKYLSDRSEGEFRICLIPINIELDHNKETTIDSDLLFKLFD